jgi:GT2 family glycosyltransferase
LKDIAVVILNWNGRKYLERFLPNVVTCSGDARIVVADNASTDDSLSFLRDHYPNIEIISNASNGGFAKGYNDALMQIESEYYVLLNSDIEVTKNWLEPLRLMLNDPSIAGVQPKVLSYDNKQQFEHAGAAGGFIDRDYFPFCRGRIFDKFEDDHGQYDHATEVFWATGACLMIRSSVFREAGGFDEAFFAHMEEIDLCWRLKLRGYAFYVEPKSIIYHVGGGTLPYLSPQKSYLNFRNSLFMLIKNHQGFLPTKLFYRLCLDGIAAIRFLLLGEWKHLASVWNAHMAVYRRLPTLLKQRREIKVTANAFNRTGLFKGSIIWARYFKGIATFSALNQRLFVKK